MPVRDYSDLTRAVEASDRAFGLLKWLGDLVDAERIDVPTARRILRSPDAALEFLTRHRASLPRRLVPSDEDGECLTANILGTYLSVSFDLEDDPADVSRQDPNCAPGCPWCRHVTKGPHLRAKKVTPTDKRRADAASQRALAGLMAEVAMAPDDAESKTLLDSFKTELAVIAYSEALIDRSKGERLSTTALALWRRFAWQDGAPREDFRFDVSTAQKARMSILNELATRPT